MVRSELSECSARHQVTDIKSFFITNGSIKSSLDMESTPPSIRPGKGCTPSWDMYKVIEISPGLKIKDGVR